MCRTFITSCFVAAAACATVPTAAGAEGFSETSVQLLQGFGFDDPAFGNLTESGRMTTLTFEHFGSWTYGDNYLLVDVYQGDFLSSSGEPLEQRVRAYLEWTPRVGLGKVLGREEGFFGFLEEIFLAGQLGRDGAGFSNNMVGLGVAFAAPERVVLGLNGFLRDDNFNRPTYHFTPYLVVPVALGPTELVVNAYVDIAGTDEAGTDVSSQPQLLLDLLAPFGTPRVLHAGVEWYFHRNALLVDHAPQAMLRWTW